MKPMSEGDKALIELVSKWGDSRLAKYLLKQMQAFGQDPYVVYRLMTTTTSVLEDEELEQISTKYGEAYYEDGDSFVDKGDMEKEAVDNDADENEAATEVEEGSGDADRAASDEAEVVQQSGDEAEQAHRVTYGELRAELVWKFVARSAAVIAVAEAKEVAKPDH